MNNPPSLITIDQLIKKLEQAKEFAGGEAEVCFWNDFNSYLVIHPRTLTKNVKRQIAPATNESKSYLSLELDRIEH